ncbi:MAG TPA: sulfotransferase [Acidimicrobiia bacterium]|nr:sulfotransferase [Acidimicrobiia bacterium]
MTIRVVGAGVGRTGTNSLKEALVTLLGEPCYHMSEVFQHPEHVPVWHEAMLGTSVDYDRLFEGYSATVDWPGAALWRELAAAYPDAIVLLSVRDPDDWWRSASNTIFQVMDREMPPEMAGWREMVIAMLDRFTSQWRDEHAAKTAFVHHNDQVRAAIAPERLVEWRPGDGWEPLCGALGVAVPSEPFPHTNTTAEFRQMAGLD